MSGPLTQVLRAITDGASSRHDIVVATQLDAGVVDAALDHLQRLGQLQPEQLSSGCPDGGCTSCVSGKSDGSAGCGASGPANARGPVLLRLAPKPNTD